MLRVLLKKQMLEIFQTYFYDARKNRARSSVSIALCFIAFILLVAGLLGGIFTFLSLELCRPFAENGMDWLYFSIMGLIAVFLGVLGSVFNTYAGLYLAKDNDLLLSLPIPASALLLSRVIGVYLMGLMYSAVVMVPASIVYWAAIGISVRSVSGSLLLIMIISVLVLVLSCICGWAAARISQRLKHRSLIAVMASLLFIVVYYFVYFRAQAIISNIAGNAVAYGENIRRAAYPLYMLGCAGTGDLMAALIIAVFTVALAGLMWRVLSHSFASIVSSSGIASQKTCNKERKTRQKSIRGALLSRECSHFLSSPSYILNCGLGIFMMPLCGAAVLLKRGWILSQLNGLDYMIPVLAAAVICMLLSLNFMVVPSVSLEGSTLWIIRSLPVSSWHVICAKIMLQLIFTGLPMLLCIICFAAVIPASSLQILLILASSASFVVLMALSGISLGLRMPNLVWTSEQVPIKQSLPVLITLFGGCGYAALFLIGYIILGGFLSASAYIGCFIAINAVLCTLLFIWLRKAGCRIFESL